MQLVRQSPAMPTSDAASGLTSLHCSTDYVPGVPMTGSASASAASDAFSTPTAPTASPPLSKTPLTLRRTVLHLSKAGYVPLVESHGADTRPWKNFCNAVGKGGGGREDHGLDGGLVVYGERRMARMKIGKWAEGGLN